MIFFDVIALVGLLQGFVIALLIFTNKMFQNEVNNYIAYFLLLLSIIGFDSNLSKYYADLGVFWGNLFYLLFNNIPSVMIFYLPLFRFFQKTSGNLQLSFPFWVLFVPFILFTAIFLIIELDLMFHVISSPFFTDNQGFFKELKNYISILMFMALHLFAYLRFIKITDVKWIKRLWWYFSVLIFIWIIVEINYTFFDHLFLRSIEITLWSLVSIFIYWLMYAGLFQFNLANNRQEIRKRLLEPLLENTPKKTGLSTKSKAYFDQLMEFILVDKAYRNPDLGRDMVARHLGISPSYLTQLIKDHTEKNLATFINEFRVEEVKKMLADPNFNAFDHLSIGLEAGFKSKSAYYNFFKNHTGQTPAQYKRGVS